MSDQGWDDDDPGWGDGADEPFEDDGFDEEAAAAPSGGGGGRGRALLVVLAILVVVAIGAVTAIAASRDDGDDTAGDGTTSTSSLGLPGTPRSTTSTTGAAGSTSTTVGVAGSSTTSTTAKAGGSTSTTSTTIPDGPKEPACSPLAGGGAAVPAAEGWQSRWTTKPEPNDPLTLSFCVDDRTPKVGQVVTLTAHVADPDATVSDDECSLFVAWTGDDGNLCFDTLTPGPKPTPPERTGAQDHDLVAKRTFVYGAEQVGPQTVIVHATSGGGRDASPYSSDATAKLGLTVHP